MDEIRPAAFFIGESTALDFVNSVAAPRSTEFEWLASGDDVLDWLHLAGLLSETERSALAQPKHETALERAAADLRTFREEFRDLVHLITTEKQVPPDHALIAKLNHLMAQGQQSLRLVASGSDDQQIALKLEYDIASPEDLLPRIAASCAEFIAKADLRYVRLCEGSGCTLFFNDVSKNHKRRWCSMEVCGNRAKAAAYRNRT
ncbi:CGNR zinc finger [Pelagimonas phthalicica]|uniref:CGNR zinc finger n=1 Tax=Pelagimonas phthalicica TaxID=1037362 RepID=A0A238JFN4_9RHOB|nr:CGNR zinc finger domain-containing protein [Pelagimonas phthalicica]TDS92417.1 putative RNA-binding Zn ribbon-like protein [Pelagimonas phthalicica]SMX29478.1 CGNR zinc finger [Pelagimonas phthalicica]